MSAEVPVERAPATGPTAVGVPGSSRVVELDILRGVAILLVLGMHSPTGDTLPGPLRPLDLAMHRFGWTGVDLFFVLSGFLIGGLLFTELERRRTIAFKRFAMRRILRLWPMYYAFLAFVYIRMLIESRGAALHSLGQLWPALIHTQNLIEVRPQLWSLAIEEQFYLFLPILLWLLIRNRPDADSLRVIPKICIGLMVGSLVARTVLTFTTHLYIERQTFLRVDSMFFGVTLAYLRIHRPAVLERVAAKRWLVPVAILLLVPAVLGRHVQQSIGLTGLYVGYGLIMIRMIYPQYRSRSLNVAVRSSPARLVAWIGVYSYSIYLWHYDTGWPGFVWGQRLGEALGLPGPAVWLLHTITWFAMSVVTGVIIGKILEVPIMRLRERLFPPTVSGNAAITVEQAAPHVPVAAAAPQLTMPEPPATPVA
jgi:peptidoglycan/LPS O-acetylase OafA/YrhL